MQIIGIKSDQDSFEESEQTSSKFKNKVFYVMDKMIDFNHNSFLVELFFLVIQTFQLIGIMDQPWMRNSELTSTILSFMQSLLFVPYFISNTQANLFQVLFYLSFTIVLMLIMSFLSTSILIEQNKQIKEKQKLSHKIIFSFMDFVVSVMTKVLYIPFFQLFCSTFRCERNISNQFSATGSQQKYYNSITKNECFSTIQIFNLFLSIISLILLHYFNIIFNKMYFDARLDCTYKNSKISGKYELYLQYFVSTFSIVTAFLFQDKYQIIRIIFSVAWWFHLLKMLNSNVLYNGKLFTFFKLEQALIVFWTSLIGVYNYFLPGSTIVVFFWIVGIIFLTIYNVNYEPVNNDICSANSYNYVYASDSMKQLRVLCYAVARYNQYSLKIDGFLNIHRNDCNLASCPSRSNTLRIKKFNKMLANQTANEDLIMSIFVIQTIFDYNIIKFRGSNQVRLLYALFLLETFQNKDQALTQLYFLQLSQPSIEEEFIVYRLKKIILQMLNHNHQQKIDFSFELTIDEYSNKFKKILNKSIQNLIQFYQELLEIKPQAQNLSKKGSQFIDNIKTIKSQFEDLVQQKSLNQSVFRIYQSFQLNILEEKESFEILQKQIQEQNEQKGEDEEGNMKDEDTYTQGVIVISSQEENFANIVEVNLEMLKIIGLAKSQVLSKNISFLIPNIWQQYHNQFIDQFLATGQKKIIGQSRDLFLKNQQNYPLPVKLNIKIIPSQTQGLLFQAQVVAQNILYDYSAFIITNLNGQIDTISPSTISLFNLDMKKIKQGIFIEKIIPDFWEYIFEFQHKQGKQLIIKTYHQKMMKDSKVKIHVQQIKFMNLSSQGYIITIKLSKSEIRSQPTLNQTCKREQSYIKKSPTQSSQKNKIFSGFDESQQVMLQETKFKYAQSIFLQKDKLSTFNEEKNNLSNMQKLQDQVEIFYDMRTHTYQGVMIDQQKHSNYEEFEQDSYSKKQWKQIFSSTSLSSKNQMSILNDRSNYKLAQMYPFIYSFVRSKEERVQDILDNSKRAKQEQDAIDTEVQKILENLIKMQQNRMNKKFTSKFLNKSKITNKNNENIFPSVYIKSHEIQKAQEEYMNKVENLILNTEKKQEKAHLDDESNHPNFQKDYGVNIKTMRLQLNKIIDFDLNTENEDQFSESADQNIKNNQNILQYESYEGDYQKELVEIILSKKNIKSFLKDNNFNHNSCFFTCKQIFSLLFLVFEIAYISISLELYQQQCSNTITRFQMYNVTNLFYANTQHIIEGVFNMFAIDKGVYYNYDNLDYSTAEFLFQKYLESETMYQFGLDEILTKLYLNKVGVTQEMEDLFINNRNIKILIHFIHLQTSVYPNNLYQASQQVLAKVYHYKRIPLGKFGYHNNDIYINVENLSNQLLNQIIQQRDLQEQEIFSYLNSVQSYTQKIILIGLLFLLCYLVLALNLYLKTLYCYFEVPSILTTLPLSQIRSQIKLYDQTLSILFAQEEDDNQHNEIQEQKNQDQNKRMEDFNYKQNQTQEYNFNIQEQKSPQKSKISQNHSFKNQNMIKQKKNQNSVQNLENSNNTENISNYREITSQNIRPIKYSIFNMKLIIPFFFSLIFFSVFIIVDTILTQNFTNLLKSFYQELTYSAKLEPEFMLLFNCLKSQTQANNYVGVRQVYEPIVYFKQNINSMYVLMDNLTYTHYNNQNILPTSYQYKFNQYFSKNSEICDQLFKKNPQYVNQTECISYMNGELNQGLSININHLIDVMISYSQSIASGNILLPYKHSVNQEMYQAQILLNYLKLIMRELNDLLINGVESLSQNLHIVRIGVSIAISSLLFIKVLKRNHILSSVAQQVKQISKPRLNEMLFDLAKKKLPKSQRV
ncbi:hypothetical protein ABPG72_020549 [Tetrahymena utriculariae]